MNLAYPYHGILLSNTKELTIDICINLDEFLEKYTDKKKPILKLHTILLHLYNILGMTRELRRGWGEREINVAIKGKHEGSLREQKCSVS